MKWIVRLLVVAGLVAGGWYARHTWLAPKPVAVVTAAVEEGRVEETLVNTRAGTVKARRRAKLSTGTSGVVVELGVERGQRMEEGDILLRLDDRTEAAELLRAERSLALAEVRHTRACLTAERAQRVYERDRNLFDDGRIRSEDQVDASKTAWDLTLIDCQVAAAEVSVAEAVVVRARADLDLTVLRAPFAAIIAEVGIELGEWVTPSVPLLAAPELIDAIDPTSIYVAAPMDEVDANRLELGQTVRVTVDSHPGESFPGRIARIAPYVLDLEQQNRTLEVEVELDDQGVAASLLPGTSADVEVLLRALDDVLRVPSYALLEGDRVIVLEGGVLVSREAQVGLRDWEWAEVIGGLARGERVVTSLDRPGIVAGAEAYEEGSPLP